MRDGSGGSGRVLRRKKQHERRIWGEGESFQGFRAGRWEEEGREERKAATSRGGGLLQRKTGRRSVGRAVQLKRWDTGFSRLFSSALTGGGGCPNARFWGC